MIRSFDQTLINQLNSAYLNKENVEQLKGVSIYHEPFTHCVINDVITDSTSFLNELSEEMNSKLKYLKKNNDLYKFHQTADLAKNKCALVKKFRDEILYGKFLDFLKNVTNIDFSSTKIDVTSSKYDFSDYLLCHDDDIHDMNNFGRRVAFVFYLVPDDWCTDGSDGGNLDLFKVDDKLNPTEIFKSLIPKRNSLIFFEVSDRSFHQVSEVFSKTKTRLSINGWFHGPINYRPVPESILLPVASDFKKIEADLFFEWIAEKYLKPTSQTDIQLVFASSSEIKLDQIFNSKKYEEVAEALGSSEIKWIRQGPANKRCYELAEIESLPKIVHDIIEILTSDCMGLTLSNMTALRLHPSMPKIKCDETEDDDDDFSDDEEDEDEGDEEITENDEEASRDKDEDEKLSETKKRKNDESTEKTKPCSSKQADEKSDGPLKKLKKSEDSNEDDDDDDDDDDDGQDKENLKKIQNDIDENIVLKEKPAIDENKEEKEEPFTGKCYFEVRRWRHGHYTLVTDDNLEIKTKALDMILFFKCQNWNLECGGNISYIARNEDDELLTVQPEDNCASLVYRDEETLKFTKYINSRIKETCFYEISLIYYE